MKRNPQTVTVEDILKVIEKRKVVKGKKVKWFLDHENLQSKHPPVLIRAKIRKREFCPITFYCFAKTGKFFSPAGTNLAAKRCNIPNRRHDSIVRAADNLAHPIIRKKLLQATGLLEKARKNGEKI